MNGRHGGGGSCLGDDSSGTPSLSNLHAIKLLLTLLLAIRGFHLCALAGFSFFGHLTDLLSVLFLTLAFELFPLLLFTERLLPLRLF